MASDTNEHQMSSLRVCLCAVAAPLANKCLNNSYMENETVSTCWKQSPSILFQFGYFRRGFEVGKYVFYAQGIQVNSMFSIVWVFYRAIYFAAVYIDSLYVGMNKNSEAKHFSAKGNWSNIVRELSSMSPKVLESWKIELGLVEIWVSIYLLNTTINPIEIRYINELRWITVWLSAVVYHWEKTEHTCRNLFCENIPNYGFWTPNFVQAFYCLFLQICFIISVSMSNSIFLLNQIRLEINYHEALEQMFSVWCLVLLRGCVIKSDTLLPTYKSWPGHPSI